MRMRAALLFPGPGRCGTGLPAGDSPLPQAEVRKLPLQDPSAREGQEGAQIADLSPGEGLDAVLQALGAADDQRAVVMVRRGGGFLP